MSDISIEVGKRVRTFRKRQGLTLDQLALLVCKSKSTLSNYENGEIAIDIETLYELADALGVHVEQLLWNGLSSRPLMPVAAKMRLSRSRLKEDAELVQELKVLKEDIRLFKLYNMFPVV